MEGFWSELFACRVIAILFFLSKIIDDSGNLSRGLQQRNIPEKLIIFVGFWWSNLLIWHIKMTVNRFIQIIVNPSKKSSYNDIFGSSYPLTTHDSFYWKSPKSPYKPHQPGVHPSFHSRQNEELYKAFFISFLLSSKSLKTWKIIFDF
jgi:hypothetical protein